MEEPRQPTFRGLGPGLLLAATGIGAGDMVAASIAGAEYGLTLVWALAAGVLGRVQQFLGGEGFGKIMRRAGLDGPVENGQQLAAV